MKILKFYKRLLWRFRIEPHKRVRDSCYSGCVKWLKPLIKSNSVRIRIDIKGTFFTSIKSNNLQFVDYWLLLKLLVEEMTRYLTNQIITVIWRFLHFCKFDSLNVSRLSQEIYLHSLLTVILWIIIAINFVEDII